MKLTVRNIASVAGVSPASVSRYMNSKGTEVSEELCRKIEEGLRQLGAEESICRSQRRPIMILLSHLRFSFYSRVLRELLDQEERGEYIFFLVQHDPDSLETVKSFVRRIHPEGVIYFEEEIGGPILKYLQDSGIRTVMCGGSAIDDNSDMVHINDIRAAYAGTRYLTDLGHKRILFLSDDIQKIGAGFQRLSGCQKALEDIGQSLPPEMVSYGPVTFDAGYQAVKKALEGKLKFTSVFAFSDELAVGAMAALYDAGLRVPQDVSVLGFDDLPIATQVRPRLTTIHQPLEAIVAKTLEIFGQGNQESRSEILLKHSITERESCCRIQSPEE